MYRFNNGLKPRHFKLLEFKYNKCIGSILKDKRLFKIDKVFKYNKCIGSIEEQDRIIQLGINLNTTNVSVQYRRDDKWANQSLCI